MSPRLTDDKLLVANHYITSPSSIQTDRIQWERMQRVSEYAKEKFFFEYGRLLDDHPLNLYLRDLLREVFPTQAEKYQVHVLPEWRAVNAVALPDHTILVSAGLLKFVDYREELKAALIHEIIHCEANRAQVCDNLLREMQDSNGSEFITHALSFLGVQRAQEYEADLRWMFGEFEKCNVNPLGQILFMEKLEERYQRFSPEDPVNYTHGDLNDRILNTESIFYFFDVHSLSHDLGDNIPEEIRQQANLLTETHHVDFSSEIFEKDTNYDDIQRNRPAMAHQIPTRALGLAIPIIANLINFDRNNPQDSVNQSILQILAERVDQELFPEERWPDPEARMLARGLFYELYIGISYLLPDSWADRNRKEFTSFLKKQHSPLEEHQTLLSGLDDFDQIIDILVSSEFQALPLPPIVVSPRSLNKRMARFVRVQLNLELDLWDLNLRDENKLLEDDHARVTSYIDRMAQWTKRLAEFYQHRGTDITATDTVFDQSMELLFEVLEKKDPSLLEYARQKGEEAGLMKTQETPPDHQRSKRHQRVENPAELDPMAEQIAQMLSKKPLGTRPYNPDSYRKITTLIQERLQGKGLEEVCQFYNDLKWATYPSFEKAQKNYRIMNVETSTGSAVSELIREERNFKQTCYILFRLFEQTLQENPQFQTLSSVVRLTLLYIWRSLTLSVQPTRSIQKRADFDCDFQYIA